MEQKKETLLEIHDMSVSFLMYDHGLERRELKVISDLYLTVKPGEIVAVVGASGSGKSLLAEALLGLLPSSARVGGHIHYKGEELTKERQKALVGRKIAFIPQSVSYLDPLMKIGKQVEGQKRREIFSRLNLANNTEKLYPYQLSGGMARRVLVSSALITDAVLVIADEPTPGMSHEQALETMKMFREMAENGKAVILITHDIDNAVESADRVAVFYAGTTVEIASSKDFASGPDALRHPYSKALWAALPQNGFKPFPGFQPYAGNLPPGCLFAPRCPYKTEQCINHVPPIRSVRGGTVRCYYDA